MITAIQTTSTRLPPATAAPDKAAAQMVSQLFFAPMLAEMRKLPFGQKFGGGGRMEEVFGEQLDTRIADRAAANTRGLTAVFEKYLQPQGTAETQGTHDVYA